MTTQPFDPDDGWISVPPETDHPERIHLRVRHEDGRLPVITDLYIHGPEITNEILRGISISRLQARVRIMLIAYTRWPGGGPTSAGFPAHPARERLMRPSGNPSEFYPRVAAAYLEYATTTRAAAKEIAAEAGVPATTAQRWIAEARRRGHLPAAQRKGRTTS